MNLTISLNYIYTSPFFHYGIQSSVLPRVFPDQGLTRVTQTCFASFRMMAGYFTCLQSTLQDVKCTLGLDQKRLDDLIQYISPRNQGKQLQLGIMVRIETDFHYLQSIFHNLLCLQLLKYQCWIVASATAPLFFYFIIHICIPPYPNHYCRRSQTAVLQK